MQMLHHPLQIRGSIFGRCVRRRLQFSEKNFKLTVGSLLRGKARAEIVGFSALSHGGTHVAVDVDRHVQRCRDRLHLRQLIFIVPGQTDAHLDRDVPLSEQANAPNDLFVLSGCAAQRLVCSGVRTVEGYIDPAGPVFREEIRPGFVDQGAVGVDADDHSHGKKTLIYFSEFRVKERLPAGEENKQGPGGFHLFCQVEPFGGGVRAAVHLHFRGGKTDVAHPAVEVAQGREFEGAAEGPAEGGGAFDEHLFN